jgi:hypothetical protein
MSEAGDPTVRRVFLTVFLALIVIYSATLAPGLTLWDAGEFLAAVQTLGIPHPPGTPLFVFTASIWAKLLPFMPLATAVNLFSAVATAAACALLGARVTRWTRQPLAGVLGGVVAGTMAAVWQSATETEVYATAFLLGAFLVVAGDVAGEQRSARHRLLLAYLLGLGVPLHLSALVSGPAAILLAVSLGSGRPSIPLAASLLGAFALAVGLGSISLVPAVGGLALLVFATLRPDRPNGMRRWEPALSALLVLAGASFAMVMLARAAHDPMINQGNPVTWRAFLDVVSRAQYEVPPLWPRRAPFWLQIGNLFQYADWQIAWGLDDFPGASLARTPFTMAFLALGGLGSLWHHARDRRSWRGMAVLLLAASLGVVIMLNLRAGPSFGFGVLPAGADREPREREYFFALAFAVWGLWAGMGAWSFTSLLLRRWRKPAMLTAVVALVPLLLNWGAVTRRREPEASVASRFARALLATAPANAVMLVAGDNDTYSVWYTQAVERLRPDVTTITLPLLGADWYREELMRRHGLLDSAAVSRWLGEEQMVRRMALAADALERPFAAAVSVESFYRDAAGSHWELTGMAYVRRRPDPDRPGVPLTVGDAQIDVAQTRAAAALIENIARPPVSQEPRDATARYLERLIECPSLAMQSLDGESRAGQLLDSFCNRR